MADRDGSSLAPASSLRPKLRGEEVAYAPEGGKFELPISEVSIVGLAIVGIALAFLVFRSQRPKYADDQPQIIDESKLPPLNLPKKRWPVTSETTRTFSKSQPTPFDEHTSEHLSKPQVVCGKAWVTDGDTIVIKKTQIRLFGIDAPELNHPYGQKAKWAMVKLCKGHVVRAEITDVDDYGRTVAHCTLPDGRDLSAELVKMGLAIDWPKFSGGKYAALEPPGVRKKLWLANARQNGKMYLWEQYEYDQLHAKKH